MSNQDVIVPGPEFSACIQGASCCHSLHASLSMKKLVGCGVYILLNKIMRLSDAYTNRITPLLLASLVMRLVCCIGLLRADVGVSQPSNAYRKRAVALPEL
jgi:hypothetical protein